MKKLIYLSIALVFLGACKPKDPKTQLAELKKQQADLSTQISALEAKIGTKDSVKVTVVNALVIKPGKFTNYVEIQGKIDAQDNVIAYPQAAGVITAIYVKAGQHVSKGQLLVQLDNSVLKQNIAQAQAQINLLSTIFERQKNLWDQKIGTEIQYLQAKTNLEASQKQLAGIKEQSDMYTIKSPINGSIDQMDLKLGQAASPGLSGIRVVNADILKVKADVPESYAGSVHLGDDVKMLVPDANDSLVAKISFAAKVIDPASRSFAIEIKLPNRSSLRPNMTTVLRIANYTSNNAVIIPTKAIQKSENGDFVFVNVNGVAKRKIVKEGASSGGLTEIKMGLVSGDEIITAGANELEEGDHVKVLPSGN